MCRLTHHTFTPGDPGFYNQGTQLVTALEYSTHYMDSLYQSHARHHKEAMWELLRSSLSESMDFQKKFVLAQVSNIGDLQVFQDQVSFDFNTMMKNFEER